MSNQRNNLFLTIFDGYPMEFRWAGWRSDSHTLRRSGWEVMAHETMLPYRNQMVIHMGARSRDKKTFIHGTLSCNPRELMPDEYHSGPPPLYELLYRRGFDMQAYEASDYVKVHGDEMENHHMNKMRPIDVYGTTDMKINDIWRNISIGSFKIFQDAEPETTSEIYIPYDSVDECFNRILELQYPQQEEIRRNLIMPEKKPLIQAKIFTLAA